MDRRLNGPQNLFEQRGEKKILAITEPDPSVAQFIASHYTYCRILETIIGMKKSIKEY
jgi:hypothetical protein